MNNPSHHFSDSYAHARQQFLVAAAFAGAHVESHVLSSHRGLSGEELATDVARLGPSDTERLLILSSGTHGPEGFCGSGCQVALLQDSDWLERVARSGVAVLMVHAVNPYGFSYLQRTNEDNVDPNRNCLRFDEPLPVNTAYAEVEPLLVPSTWPPSVENERALAEYIAARGNTFRDALKQGQSTSPDGLFFSGRRPIWSNVTLRHILRQHGAQTSHIGWVDIHTGLGPNGHGEKIYAGRNDAMEIARASAWFGADVTCPFSGDAISPDVRGPVTRLIYDECPNVKSAQIALEFGTHPTQGVRLSMRASSWVRRLGDGAVADAQRARIRQQARDAYYCDNDVWKGMVLGQTRVISLQTLIGLKNAS